MRVRAPWFLGVGLLVSAALVFSGCGGCPMCNFFKKMMGGGSQAAPAEPAKPGAQTTCPILGGKINRQLYVDYEGKRIYVCCAACIPKVRTDPAKCVAQLEAKGVVLDRVPTAP